MKSKEKRTMNCSWFICSIPFTRDFVIDLAIKVKVKVILRQLVGQYVSGTHLGPATNFFPVSLWLFLDSYGFVDVGCLLWREDGSVICSAMTQVQFQVILLTTACLPLLRLIVENSETRLPSNDLTPALIRPVTVLLRL
jgi:hypothetical protein